MKETRILMDMPITIEIVDPHAAKKIFPEIFAYFTYVDNKFSTFKKSSEITGINMGLLSRENYSEDMKMILALCQKTKKETDGYFNILRDGQIDPSGLVKGWAIYNAANLIKSRGFSNYFVDAGGDIQVNGHNIKGNKWQIGIRNPFNRKEIVKIINADYEGVATSGTYIRGQHIYNPFKSEEEIKDIISMTVIGPNIYEADRFATAAFAMGKSGIEFIERLNGFEGYMIDKDGIATYTDGFERYCV